MRQKLLFLILDGAADRPVDNRTPLTEADTPGLDELASHAICGFHYPVEPGVAPESDLATISLLGYNPDKYYTGRGPLEALGIGLSLREGYEVAFRANFATIDPSTRRIIDRRVGRSLSSDEARELAKSLDGMRLSLNGYVVMKATIGHRAVVIIGSESEKLSAEVQNIDPAYIRKGKVSIAVRNPDMVLPRCQPLVDTPEAKNTCILVDEFVERAIEILDNHEINKKRAKKGLLKANVVLLRDAGDKMPKMPPLTTSLGFGSAAAIAEMPVEIGIARAAGMKIYAVSPPSGSLEKDLPDRLRETIKALRENEFVYVHLKGPDEPGHDGDFERKTKAIELIDKYFVQPLINKINLEEVAILVTSDHATPWSLKSHSGDPVPWMLSSPLIRESLEGFNEIVCSTRAKQRFRHGWELLPWVKDYLQNLTR